VSSAAEVEALLSRAAASRATGATASNNASSRSHSVFVLRVTMTHAATSQTRHGVLNLIDLAGSEVRVGLHLSPRVCRLELPHRP
jgi:kinesin family member C1